MTTGLRYPDPTTDRPDGRYAKDVTYHDFDDVELVPEGFHERDDCIVVEVVLRAAAGRAECRWRSTSRTSGSSRRPAVLHAGLHGIEAALRTRGSTAG